MSEISTLKKYKIILEEFENKQNKMLTAYDQVLIDKLDLSPKQIDRLIKELSFEFNNIIEIKGTKKKTYKLTKPIDLFVEAFDKSEEIGWFFNMAHDADPDIFRKLEQFTNENKNIYKFQNTPFEDLSTVEEKNIFRKLKRAVKNREYVKLKYKFTTKEYDNLRCLKLIFIDNNWYLAFSDNQDKLRLGRISFIKEVNYATKAESFQLSAVKDHVTFLNTKLQNSMTKYGAKIKKAKFRALPRISRYFDNGMKKFLSTQKFIEKLDDGSILFSLEYSQEIEILPFVQSWMPNLIILEPIDLSETYMKNLEITINNHS